MQRAMQQPRYQALSGLHRCCFSQTSTSAMRQEPGPRTIPTRACRCPALHHIQPAACRHRVGRPRSARRHAQIRSSKGRSTDAGKTAEAVRFPGDMGCGTSKEVRRGTQVDAAGGVGDLLDFGDTKDDVRVQPATSSAVPRRERRRGKRSASKGSSERKRSASPTKRMRRSASKRSDGSDGGRSNSSKGSQQDAGVVAVERRRRGQSREKSPEKKRKRGGERAEGDAQARKRSASSESRGSSHSVEDGKTSSVVAKHGRSASTGSNASAGRKKSRSLHGTKKSASRSASPSKKPAARSGSPSKKPAARSGSPSKKPAARSGSPSKKPAARSGSPSKNPAARSDSPGKKPAAASKSQSAEPNKNVSAEPNKTVLVQAPDPRQRSKMQFVSSGPPAVPAKGAPGPPLSSEMYESNDSTGPPGFLYTETSEDRTYSDDRSESSFSTDQYQSTDSIDRRSRGKVFRESFRVLDGEADEQRQLGAITDYMFEDEELTEQERFMNDARNWNI